jgi:hypothetical protein
MLKGRRRHCVKYFRKKIIMEEEYKIIKNFQAKVMVLMGLDQTTGEQILEEKKLEVIKANKKGDDPKNIYYFFGETKAEARASFEKNMPSAMKFNGNDKNLFWSKGS